MILAGFFAVIILSVWGMSFLYGQNRFIDYYKEDTEIYRGMEVIDRKLGGTTPLDIVIDAPQDFLEFQKEEEAMMAEDGFGVSESSPILNGYWFSGLLLEDIARIHNYLDGLPETGKVLSFHTTAQLLQGLGDVEELNRFFLGVLYNKLPEDVKGLLFSPYISNDGNQLRFSVRVFESTGKLDRQTLLKKNSQPFDDRIGDCGGTGPDDRRSGSLQQCSAKSVPFADLYGRCCLCDDVRDLPIAFPKSEGRRSGDRPEYHHYRHGPGSHGMDEYSTRYYDDHHRRDLFWHRG